MKMIPAKLASEQDGLELGLLYAAPEQGPVRGIVQICHGMSEHKERYIPFLEFLCQNGYACVIHDHRGHGESVRNGDDLGHFYENGAQSIVEDAHQVTLYIKEKHPGLPVCLFGHSMGSMVVRLYTKQYDHDIDALVVCGSPSKNPLAPAGRILAKTMALVKGGHYRSRLIQSMAFGNFNRAFENPKSENAWICSDEQEVQRYDDDPLCGFVFTLNGFENLFALMERTYSRKGWAMQNPALPILFVSGKEDPCRISDLKFMQAVDFMKSCGYLNTEFRLYEGARHEILNEPICEAVYADVLHWLQVHMKQPGL